MTASDGLSPILVEGDRAKTRRGSQEVDCLWHTTVARDSIVPLHQTISAPLYAFQRQTATESFKFVLCLFDGSRVETTATTTLQRRVVGKVTQTPVTNQRRRGRASASLALPCPLRLPLTPSPEFALAPRRRRHVESPPPVNADRLAWRGAFVWVGSDLQAAIIFSNVTNL